MSNQAPSQLATSAETAEFIPLLNFENDYEILNYYPFTIRKKSNKKELKDINHNAGYINVKLNGKIYFKHRVIALQFIHNPDPALNDVVDHINRIRNDNHIENLRWVSYSENNFNKSSNCGVVYQFVDTIPDDSIHVTDYGEHQFEDLYFYDNTFYFYNGQQYRVMHISENKRGNKYINFNDVDDKKVKICYSRFKRLYDIVD